jgi:hypothetical protein
MAQQISPIETLKRYAPVLFRKLGFIALGWVVLYFLSHPFRVSDSRAGINVLVLFAPMLGALGGLVAGWYLVDKAGEDSEVNGMALWVPLILMTWLTIGVVEGVMRLLFRSWEFGFGGFMEVMAAMLLSGATIVWYGSSQE